MDVKGHLSFTDACLLEPNASCIERFDGQLPSSSNGNAGLVHVVAHDASNSLQTSEPSPPCPVCGVERLVLNASRGRKGGNALVTAMAPDRAAVG